MELNSELECNLDQNLTKLLSAYIEDPAMIKFIVDRKKQLYDSLEENRDYANRWSAGEGIKEQWIWSDEDEYNLGHWWENPRHVGPKEENPEIYENEVWESGKKEPEKQWIKCPRDVSKWVENPYYHGPDQPHPIYDLKDLVDVVESFE